MGLAVGVVAWRVRLGQVRLICVTFHNVPQILGEKKKNTIFLDQSHPFVKVKSVFHLQGNKSRLLTRGSLIGRKVNFCFYCVINHKNPTEKASALLK